VNGKLHLLRDRIRSSLFVIPALCVVGGIVLAQVMLWIDTGVSAPEALTSTVESARVILTTIAAATVTFASITFSVRLLLISLASSQYSPRVVNQLLRDPFSVRVMGTVVGTFSYCLLVLRTVRSPLEIGGTAVIPSYSIIVALILGLIAILGLVGFINHSAHSMDVSNILDSITGQSMASVKQTWTEEACDGTDREAPKPPDNAICIEFAQHGWIKYVDSDQLLKAIPKQSSLVLETVAGRYAIPGTPLAFLWPEPDEAADGDGDTYDADDADDVASKVRAAVQLGETRTMQQDSEFGIRQLADVALKALSPSMNDPTTARDAVLHMAAVIIAMFDRFPPTRLVTGDDGRTIWRPHETSHEEVVRMAFDEIRISSSDQPVFAGELIIVLHQLHLVAGSSKPALQAAIKRQAQLITDAVGSAELTPADQQHVQAIFERYFE